MFSRRTAGVLLLTLALACGCESSPAADGPLPDATTLLSAAAASFDGLHSVRYDLSVSGTIPGLEIREVKGQVSRDGVATGHADIQRATNVLEFTFLIQGTTVYLTDKQGNTTTQPVPAGYSPTSLLDPARGISRLLREATQLKTETREDVEGVQTYRVAGEVAQPVVSSVVPAIQQDVVVKFWVTQSEPRALVRVWMQVPPQQPNEGAVMLELALSDVNVPVGAVPSE